MRALLVGGTGMLGGVARTLLDGGWSVLVPARRKPRAGDWAGADWIRADWTDPPAFVDTIVEHLDGPPDLLVLWCHTPYRAPVAEGLAGHLTVDTTILEVVGSSNLATLVPEQHRCYATSTLVVLGARGGRWLTDGEISDGVVDALRRRRDGERPDQVVVGELPST